MEAAGAIGARIAFLILAGPVGALSCCHWPSTSAFGEGRCWGQAQKKSQIVQEYRHKRKLAVYGFL